MERRGHAQKGDGTETMGFALESKWTALEWQGDALEMRCQASQAMEVHEWGKHRKGIEAESNGLAKVGMASEWQGSVLKCGG